jgi:hypothetical protein
LIAARITDAAERESRLSVDGGREIMGSVAWRVPPASGAASVDPATSSRRRALSRQVLSGFFFAAGNSTLFRISR